MLCTVTILWRGSRSHDSMVLGRARREGLVCQPSDQNYFRTHLQAAPEVAVAGPDGKPGSSSAVSYWTLKLRPTTAAHRIYHRDLRRMGCRFAW